MQKLSLLTKEFFSLPRLAVLIDPDQFDEDKLEETLSISGESGVDLILVGGSLLFGDIGQTISMVRKISNIPVYIFPGNAMHVSPDADGILFLSLISGRNADYLIGNHVIASPHLVNSGLDVVPTGYMLIGSGSNTSVEYISNTIPIPAGKHDIAVATAIAGELLGMKLIYLEAGSGASSPVGISMIQKVKENIHIPLIVGGGIKNREDAFNILKSGANMIVTGTAVENNPQIIKEIALSRNEWKRQKESPYKPN